MKISLFKSQVIVSEHLRFELLFVPNYHLRFSPKKAKKKKQNTLFTQAGRQHNMAAALEAEGQGLGGTRGCATMKKNIWVTGQLPTPSITINGPAHTPPPSPSINALAGSEVM